MSTGIVVTPAMGHNKIGHPEHNGRIREIVPFLDEQGILADLTFLTPQHATVEQLRQVHDDGLIEHVRQTSQRGGGTLDLGDTYATVASYDLARLAAGSAITAVSAILAGEIDNGFALVRPPGHHAEYATISGFCLFNNVAIAARYAQTHPDIERVLIVDFDVHHGNGTQDIFYQDDSVMFMSTHLFIPRMFYPGTGALKETGLNGGNGYTLNVPMMPYIGDQGYGRVFNELIFPKARQFQPDLILVSAGYDAHWQDPLAMAGLSLTGFAQISRQLVEMAQELSNGRILFILEGGYQIQALHFGILNTFNALIHKDNILDPLGSMPQNEQDVTDLLHTLKQTHLIY